MLIPQRSRLAFTANINTSDGSAHGTGTTLSSSSSESCEDSMKGWAARYPFQQRTISLYTGDFDDEIRVDDGEESGDDEKRKDSDGEQLPTSLSDGDYDEEDENIAYHADESEGKNNNSISINNTQQGRGSGEKIENHYSFYP